MTPAAAQLFRIANAELRKQLLSCQFFECTALYPLAQEMAALEEDLPNSVYSEFAQLPAPMTAIEFHSGGGRIILLCSQEGSSITVNVYVRDGAGKPVWRARTGFVIGTGTNLEIKWAVYPGEPSVRGDTLPPGDRRIEVCTSFNFLLEKFLCILNQPGLVDRSPKPTDKRVIRLATSERLPKAPAAWSECRIRPGTHGKPYEAGNGTPRQLHYVRKHWKPSVGKWIDGYWRGNADLGVHLKWYETKSLVGRAA